MSEQGRCSSEDGQGTYKLFDRGASGDPCSRGRIQSRVRAFRGRMQRRSTLSNTGTLEAEVFILIGGHDGLDRSVAVSPF